MTPASSVEAPSSVKSTTSVSIDELRPGEEQQWDRFVTSCSSGTLFHLVGWKRVVERVFGHKSFCFTAKRDSRITGVLPLSLVRNRIFGDCLVSMPLAVYGGICAEDAESHSALLEAGKLLATRLGVRYLELRNQAETYAESLPGRSLYVTFTQDLSPGPEKLMQALPRDTRYMVRKSLKGDLSWTEDLSLDEFYEIYARSVHHLGTPVFPSELFSAFQSEFGRQVRLFGVRKGQTAVAGVLCFYFRDQVLPYYAGALQEFYKDSPNNFMYWKLIEQSCREGIQGFDFGRSKRGTGSFAFKSAWAMQISELPYRYFLVKAKEVPQMSPVDKKFQLPVALWKKMPFSWSKVLGPKVIGWIPSI